MPATKVRIAVFTPVYQCKAKHEASHALSQWQHATTSAANASRYEFQHAFLDAEQTSTPATLTDSLFGASTYYLTS